MTDSRKWALWLVAALFALLAASFVGGWPLVAAVLAVMLQLALRVVPFVVVALLVAYARRQR